MENIVADEDCGQGLVKPVTNPQSLNSPFVALVRQRAQADLADAGVGRLAAGKIARAQQKEYIQYTTGRVHEKTNSLLFSENISFSIIYDFSHFCNRDC